MPLPLLTRATILKCTILIHSVQLTFVEGVVYMDFVIPVYVFSVAFNSCLSHVTSAHKRRRPFLYDDQTYVYFHACCIHQPLTAHMTCDGNVADAFKICCKWISADMPNLTLH